LNEAAHQLNFTTIDTVIVVVYFVSVLAIGLWISRNTKTGDDLFLAGRSLGWIAIGFSLFVVVIAALNLVLDFDFIENAVDRGAPKYMEWYGAFGLLVTLVWLYIEILHLLAKLNSRR